MQSQREFWKWFEANADRFKEIEVEEREALLDELLENLHNYCPDLWFETGRADDGISELIISAEGNVDHFSAVRTLIATAPDVPNWRFIAFKPATGLEFSTSYAGLTFDPSTAWFLPLRSNSDPTRRGARIGYAHFESTRSDEFLTGTFIMLESVIGELSLAERLHHVEVGPLPSSPESSGYLPLRDLEDWLDS